MLRLQQVRKSGLTFAPEAGTQRLRDAINKNVTEQEILDTCAIAFEGGWNNVKLYFMLGLPTETDEDVLGIAKLVYEILKTWREHASNKKRGVRIHVATAFFVPKPFTPFQWGKADHAGGVLRRARLLRDNMPSKSIEYNWHAADLSRLEAVLARGDRRLGPVLEEAVRRGARLDGWDEYFSYQTWLDAFAACGVDPEFYTTRASAWTSFFQWDTISDGVSTGCLLRERERAYRSETTPDCRTACNGCGANRLLKGRALRCIGSGFEKTGRAIWMSHLDLMRLMQRAFRRAGVVLHHSQGLHSACLCVHAAAAERRHGERVRAHGIRAGRRACRHAGSTQRRPAGGRAGAGGL